MKLTCISCMKREEIEAKTRVDWFFTPDKDNDKDQDNLPEKIHVGHCYSSLYDMRHILYIYKY